MTTPNWTWSESILDELRLHFPSIRLKKDDSPFGLTSKDLEISDAESVITLLSVKDHILYVDSMAMHEPDIQEHLPLFIRFFQSVQGSTSIHALYLEPNCVQSYHELPDMVKVKPFSGYWFPRGKEGEKFVEDMRRYDSFLQNLRKSDPLFHYEHHYGSFYNVYYKGAESLWHVTSASVTIDDTLIVKLSEPTFEDTITVFLEEKGRKQRLRQTLKPSQYHFNRRFSFLAETKKRMVWNELRARHTEDEIEHMSLRCEPYGYNLEANIDEPVLHQFDTYGFVVTDEETLHFFDTFDEAKEHYLRMLMTIIRADITETFENQ